MAPAPCGSVDRDTLLLLSARCLRMFAFGGVSVILYLHLAALGLSHASAGVLLTSVLLGDLILTLYITTHADEFGRVRVLVLGAALKLLAGIVFATCEWYPALLAAGVLGVISPSGGDTGPFLAVEQAALTDIITERVGRQSAGTASTVEAATSRGGAAVAPAITSMFGWYNALGYGAQACGALTAGWFATALTNTGVAALTAYKYVFVGYAITGVLMMFCYMRLSDAVEAPPSITVADGAEVQRAINPWLGLRDATTKSIVIRLSALYCVDAFAGGLVMQSWLVSWFHAYWGAPLGSLGSMMMAANVLSGLSGLMAARIVRRCGAVATMVFTHAPSNLLLVAVPFMPSLPAAVCVLLLRFSIAQMDVPARQAFLAMVVRRSDERSAAGGITAISRSLGVAAAPLVIGVVASSPASSLTFSSPFVIACALKLVYDATIWFNFRHEEGKRLHAPRSPPPNDRPPAAKARFVDARAEPVQPVGADGGSSPAAETSNEPGEERNGVPQQENAQLLAQA